MKKALTVNGSIYTLLKNKKTAPCTWPGAVFHEAILLLANMYLIHVLSMKLFYNSRCF